MYCACIHIKQDLSNVTENARAQSNAMALLSPRNPPLTLLLLARAQHVAARSAGLPRVQVAVWHTCPFAAHAAILVLIAG